VSRNRTIISAAAAALLSATSLAACGGGGDNPATAASTPPKAAGGKTATIGLADAGSLGKVLVDSSGRTLYLFQKDSGTTSACTGPCAAAWPPLRVSGKPTVGAGLSASKVGKSPRSDGKAQVTYNGHPLYRFQGDKQAGDTNGQGISAFGGGWFALSSAGDMVSGSGSSAGGGSSTSGGAGGY
jgi:predicted lipoprotein with Yx(FWY)xxD motif